MLSAECKRLRVCFCLTVTLCLPYIVLAVMCIYVICKIFSWDGDQQQDLDKPSQAFSGKLLGVLSHMVSEKTQSALRGKQGWTHSLQC
jgi:hypothetical protein